MGRNVAFQGCNPIYGPQYATISSKYPFCYSPPPAPTAAAPGGRTRAHVHVMGGQAGGRAHAHVHVMWGQAGGRAHAHVHVMGGRAGGRAHAHVHVMGGRASLGGIM